MREGAVEVILWRGIVRDTWRSLLFVDRGRFMAGVNPCSFVSGWFTCVFLRRRCPCFTYCPFLKINYTGYDITSLLIPTTFIIFWSVSSHLTQNSVFYLWVDLVFCGGSCREGILWKMELVTVVLITTWVWLILEFSKRFQEGSLRKKVFALGLKSNCQKVSGGPLPRKSWQKHDRKTQKITIRSLCH